MGRGERTVVVKKLSAPKRDAGNLRNHSVHILQDRGVVTYSEKARAKIYELQLVLGFGREQDRR